MPQIVGSRRFLTILLRRCWIDKNSVLEGSGRRWNYENNVLEGSRRRWIEKNSVLEGSRKTLPRPRLRPMWTASAIPEPT